MRAQNDLSVQKRSAFIHNPYRDNLLNNSLELPHKSNSVEKDRKALEVIQRKMNKLDERHQTLKNMILKKQDYESKQKKFFKVQSQIREENKLKYKEKVERVTNNRRGLERENHEKMEKLQIKLGLVKKEKNRDIVTDKQKDEQDKQKEEVTFVTEQTPVQSKSHGLLKQSDDDKIIYKLNNIENRLN